MLVRQIPDIERNFCLVFVGEVFNYVFEFYVVEDKSVLEPSAAVHGIDG